MARKFYSDKSKAAILETVKSSRAAGKSWNETHEAAKAVGYKGGLQAIIKLSRNSGLVKPGRRGRPKGSRGPGRPKGSISRATSANGFSSIEKLVEQLVKKQVREALDRAIHELQRLRG
jgi:hypothetical protein